MNRNVPNPTAKPTAIPDAHGVREREGPELSLSGTARDQHVANELRCAASAGRRASATANAIALLNDCPDAAETRSELEKQYKRCIARDRYEDAKAILAALVRARPGDLGYRLMGGNDALMRGDFSFAASHFSRVLELDQDNAQARRAMLQIEQGTQSNRRGRAWRGGAAAQACCSTCSRGQAKDARDGGGALGPIIGDSSRTLFASSCVCARAAIELCCNRERSAQRACTRRNGNGLPDAWRAGGSKACAGARARARAEFRSRALLLCCISIGAGTCR